MTRGSALDWLALVVAFAAGSALVWGLATGAMPSRGWRVRRADRPGVFWAVGVGLAALAAVAFWIFLRTIVWKVGNSV